jgi:4-hydroxythreonine-4-phosphate dehydrogenase
VSLRAAIEAAADDAVLLFGDAAVLHERALALGAHADRLVLIAEQARGGLLPGQIGLVDSGIAWDSLSLRPEATAAGGAAQLRALEGAVEAALSGRARGVVTAPMNKAAVCLSGTHFTGHTEHLARAAGLAEDSVTMMFLGPRLRVALVTTHEAVARAAAQITTPRVRRTIVHLTHALGLLGALGEGARTPRRIAVAGLNPPAGEGGLFGREEQDIVAPAMEQARVDPFVVSSGVELLGPLGAETAFRMAAGGAVDGVVAMLHDQATIASKLLDWTQAVNVTWGLPFVRTSVDHGVAYDAALRGVVDARGMTSALSMAQALTR